MKRKLLILLFSLVCVFCLALFAAACDNGGNDDEKGNTRQGDSGNSGNSGDELGAMQNYTIYTKSVSGAYLDGIKITASHKGTAASTKVANGGYARFSLAAGNYTLSYENLPEGYYVDPDYTVTSLTKDSTNVTAKFKSKVIDEPLTEPHRYSEGEVVHNFSFTDADGVTVELKELLNTYKLVLLNIWFVDCTPCAQEFPAIQSVYNRYKNDVFIISISDKDSNTAVKEYKQTKNLTLFMASDRSGIVTPSFLISYPTNVFIDRYGVVTLIDSGSRVQETFWENKFSQYVSANYDNSGLDEIRSRRWLAVFDKPVNFNEVLPEEIK